MADCPCCGREMPKGIGAFVDLATNVAVHGEQAVQLTPTQAEIVNVLLSQSPAPVSYELAYRLSSSLKYSDGPRELMAVHVCKINPKLKTIGLQIEVVRSRGYRLVVPVLNEAA